MDVKEDLLELLSRYIVHIKKNYNKKNPFNVDEKLCLELKKSINICEEDYRNINNLELAKITELISNYNKQDLRMLEYYQVILRDTEFELCTDDLKILKKLFGKLSNNIDKYINDVNNLKIERDNNVNELIEPYQNIIDKMNCNDKLGYDDVKYVYDIIKVSNLDINKSVLIMRYLFNNCFGE